MSGMELFRGLMTWGMFLAFAGSAFYAFYKVMKIESGQNRKN